MVPSYDQKKQKKITSIKLTSIRFWAYCLFLKRLPGPPTHENIPWAICSQIFREQSLS